jgi:hypothetical protein
MRMLSEILVQRDFDPELLGREAAVREGVFFVDELDGDDGVGGMEGGGLADTDGERNLVS